MVLCGGSWLVNRWLVLVASLALEVCGGAMYAYPLYSTSLRNTLGYAQWQVAALALASNIGNFCNIPSGIVMDLYGVRATVLCGVCVNFVGYFLLWLVATEAISAPFEAVFAISMLWGNGAGWFDTAVIAVNMSNFLECRGIVVGLLKSFFGLASAVLSLGFFAFFNPMGGGDDPETRTPEQLRVGAEAFILFLAVALSSLGLFLVPLLVLEQPRTVPRPARSTATPPDQSICGTGCLSLCLWCGLCKTDRTCAKCLAECLRRTTRPLRCLSPQHQPAYVAVYSSLTASWSPLPPGWASSHWRLPMSSARVWSPSSPRHATAFSRRACVDCSCFSHCFPPAHGHGCTKAPPCRRCLGVAVAPRHCRSAHQRWQRSRHASDANP